ncbi:MAG: DUF4178 domain-containing protein [Bacteroidetes bacterium]|nr:DUF4178 domain-containing protein [Bacteroidota bacterium]
MQLYTHAQAKNCGCISCGNYYRINGGNLQFVEKKRLPAEPPVLSVGKKGTIKEFTYIVTAHVIKKDTRYNFSWNEYTLFHPVEGYVYISEYNGHWMFLSPVNFATAIADNATEQDYNKSKYRLYSKYSAKILSAIGEFTGDVYKANKVKFHEFINPPEILVHECSTEETMWLHGRYMEPGEVQKAFKLDAVPARSGVGVIQPQPVSVPFNSVLRVSAIAAIAVFVLQLIFYFSASDKVVYSYSGNITDFQNGKVVSPSFDLVDGSKNMEVIVYGEVDNNWFEAGITLINEKTDEDVDLDVGVEYYHGYSDGESWSEGSRRTSKIIDAVPAGRYHLLITPVKDIAYSYIPYSIEVRRDVPVWGNFLFAIILLAIFPVVQFYRERSFEKSRWMDSDYSPFYLEEE